MSDSNLQQDAVETEIKVGLQMISLPVRGSLSGGRFGTLLLLNLFDLRNLRDRQDRSRIETVCVLDTWDFCAKLEILLSMRHVSGRARWAPKLDPD